MVDCNHVRLVLHALEAEVGPYEEDGVDDGVYGIAHDHKCLVGLEESLGDSITDIFHVCEHRAKHDRVCDERQHEVDDDEGEEGLEYLVAFEDGVGEHERSAIEKVRDDDGEDQCREDEFHELYCLQRIAVSGTCKIEIYLVQLT